MRNQTGTVEKTFLFAVILTVIFSSFGCNSFRIKAIKTELENLEPKKAASEKRVNQLDEKILRLESDVKTLQSNIRKRADWTLSYMKENAGTVACMASVGYSIGKDNLFSEDVNEVINAASVVCAIITIFSEDFRNNVIQVVDAIDESDKAIKTWETQIAKINQNLKSEYGFRKQEQEIRQSLDTEIRALKTELAQLE